MHTTRRIALLGLALLPLAFIVTYCATARATDTPSLPVNSFLKMTVKPLGTQGVVAVVLQNSTQDSRWLDWDRYSAGDLLGLFRFVVTNPKGASVPYTAHGRQLYQDVPRVNTTGTVERSMAHISLPAHGQQIIQFNLAQLYRLTPGRYQVAVTYLPFLGLYSGSAHSNTATITVTKIVSGPSLSFSSSNMGQAYTYTEP